MTCPWCDHEGYPKEGFCSNCGNEWLFYFSPNEGLQDNQVLFDRRVIICPLCSDTIDIDQSFCSKCYLDVYR